MTMPAIEAIQADPRGLAYAIAEDTVTLSNVSIPYVRVIFGKGWDRRASMVRKVFFSSCSVFCVRLIALLIYEAIRTCADKDIDIRMYLCTETSIL